MGRQLAVCAALLLLFAGGIAFRALLLLWPVDARAADQIFIVEPGDSLRRVAGDLEGEGLVRDARATAWLARLHGLARSVRSGEYELSPSWSTPRILEQIRQGRIKTYQAVFPEGLRATEIATRLENKGLADAEAFLEVVHDAEFVRSLGVEGESLEGYLFPETYRLGRNLPAQAIARTLVEQFRQVWKEIEPKAKLRNASMHDVVTLASIVEKETRESSERPLIAAVFLNRLRRGMRLETDPAVIYGIPNFDGNLRKRHLLDESNPYNTYRFAGLPPGPIANPGADALYAVVSPAETEYLYFVSRNDGTHHFSRTYREHVNAVNRYQKRRRSK